MSYAVLSVPASAWGVPQVALRAGRFIPVVGTAILAALLAKELYDRYYGRVTLPWVPYSYNPTAAWPLVGCNRTDLTVTTWRYGPGTTCGGLGFEPLGGADYSELFGWAERFDLGLPGWFNVAWQGTRTDGVVDALPPAGYVPNVQRTLPMPPGTVAGANDIPGVPGLLPIPWDLVPARDRAQDAVQWLTDRGYDVPPPRGPLVPPVVRPDAIATNPGRTFVWDLVGGRAVPSPATVVIPQALREVSANEITVARNVPRGPNLPRLPPSKTKERKGRMTVMGQAAGLPGGLKGARAFGFATEACDFVDALWDAIPFKVKLKDGVVKKLPKSARGQQEGKRYSDLDKKNWSQPGCLKKAEYIFKTGGWHDMHIPTALKNLFMNELQDRAIGTLSNKAVKAHSAAQRSYGSRGKSPVLGPAL